MYIVYIRLSIVLAGFQRFPALVALSGRLEGGFDQGGGKACLPTAGFGEVGLEAVAHGHEFIDFGDDAVLFGKGR